MKKFTVLISMFLLVFCGFGAKFSFVDIAQIMNATEYNVYTNEALKSDGVKSVNAGVFIINTMNINNTKSNTPIEKQGESFVIKGCDENKIFYLQRLTKYKVIKTENIENLKVIYAYSNMLEKSVTVDNKKVNLQIAFDGSNLTVGYPLILGSY